jgi:predicted flap endonuclease-1-like 5' DNA nuclease
MESIFNTVFALMAIAGIGCLFCNYLYARKKTEILSEDTTEASDKTVDVEASEHKPSNLLAAPSGEKDDLKRIKGVGPKLETALNALGVFHFSQIAAWSDSELEWIDDYLSFKGRAKRDHWIAQAKVLAEM